MRRALDLFCGAGGATKGLQMAGFHVTGIDINPQPRYCGDRFIQSNALHQNLWAGDFLQQYGPFDLIWASPPCQRFSRMSNCRNGLQETYPDLIALTRERLSYEGIPYIIENVEGSPLLDPVTLCGSMFGLETYRHRLFELHGFKVPPLIHPVHSIPTSKAGHWIPGTFVSIAGHCAPISKCRDAMRIQWMNREELAEAIPPVYAQFLGEKVLTSIEGRHSA